MLLAGRCLALAALLGLAIPSARAADGIAGWWLDGSKRAGIVIAPCGDGLCGTIEWLREPLDPATGKPKLDSHDPDAALRGRPLCGLVMLWSFQPAASPGAWTGGRVYDPENGSTYHARMALQPDGTLRLRGFIGIPLFGRSEIWTRLAQPPAPCTGR